MGLLVARAKLTFGNSRVITKDSSVLNVDTFKDSGMKIEFRAGYSGYQHTIGFDGLQSLDEVIIEDPNNTNSAVLVFNGTTQYNEIVLTSTGNAGVLTFKTKSKVLKRASFTNKTPAGGAETVTALKGILAFSDVITGVTITNSATNFTVPASIPSNLKQLSFTGSTYFNDPNVLTWNTTNVTNMSYMFNRASAFNQPIGNWNTTNVTSMYGCFEGAKVFNQPIGNWNVSNVTTMADMFYYASAFNQPIGNWDVSNVTNMNSMFDNASAFNQDLTTWCVAKITTTPIAFADSALNFPTNKHPVWGTCPVTVSAGG